MNKVLYSYTRLLYLIQCFGAVFTQYHNEYLDAMMC
jgi:hypothetical protein